MNGIYQDEDIKISLGTHLTPLNGIEELGTEWNLGSLTIDKRRPAWRMGWGGRLTSASHLRKQRFDFANTNQRGWALIFRSFDRDAKTGLPEEFFVGWVPPEREADADRWIDFLNSQIKDRLVGKLSTPTQSQRSAQSATREREPQPRNLPASNSASTESFPTLTPVGCFAEMGYRSGLSLVAARGKRSPTNKDRVLRYLDSGSLIKGHLGVYEDYFDASSLCGSLSLYTDGMYVWPDYLRHYVKRYDVELPLEFEQHMEANNWEVPNVHV